ncbi:hypothetical protein Q5692_03410 [Microcoleus sp. C2C3]
MQVDVSLENVLENKRSLAYLWLYYIRVSPIALTSNSDECAAAG